MAAAMALVSATSASAAPPPAETSLQLEVIRNGIDTGLIAAFERHADGRFTITASELRALGLAAPDSASPIFLDQLPGVTYRYDDPDQEMLIEAKPEVLAPTLISMRPAPSPVPVSHDSGALLNYSLSIDAGAPGAHDPFQFENIEGAFEARAFGPLGLVSSTFDVDAETGGVRETRLNTTWTWSDPRSAVTWDAGDFISGGFSWTRPIRLGGLQMRRDFGTRPDLITLPTPTLSATAAAPSTLDVMLGSSIAMSRFVPAGPVQVSDIPVMPGQGQASLVLRDAQGVQQTVSAAYFSTPQLLRAGVFDFSAETGFARRYFGLISNDYDGALVGSASARFGLSDTTTLQGHIETGAGLSNLGAAVVHGLGAFGAVSLAAAGSETGGKAGGLFALGFETQTAQITLSAQAQQTLGWYRDLAAVTAPRQTADALGDATPPRTLLQLALSAPLRFVRFGPTADPLLLAISFADEREAHGPQRSTVSAALRYQWDQRINVQAAAYVMDSERRQVGLSFMVSIPLGRRIDAIAGVDAVGGQSDEYVEVSKQERPDVGADAWRLRLGQDASGTEVEAEGVYRAGFGRLSALASVVDGDPQVQGRLDGALVWLGTPMISPDRIEGAFAAIDVGAPHVAVSEQNMPLGVSDSRGWLLARNLGPYQANHLDIDVPALPLDYAAARTSLVVNPPYDAGVLARFGVARTPPQARLTIILDSGLPAPVGTLASLNGGPADIVVGYDGEIFLARPLASNLIRIDLGGGESCTARYVIDPSSTVRLHVAQVSCQAASKTLVVRVIPPRDAGLVRLGPPLDGSSVGELHRDRDQRQLRRGQRSVRRFGEHHRYADLRLHRHGSRRSGYALSKSGRRIWRRDGLGGAAA